MDPNQPAVQISLKDIYDTLVKLVSAVDRLADQQDNATKSLADHEVRIRGLEKARWPLPSVAVVASLAADVVALLALFHR